MSKETLTQQDRAAEPLAPLVVGTTLLDRYTITDVVAASSDSITYHALATQHCPNCNVENEGTATECGFCGTELAAQNLLQLTERRLSPETREFTSSGFIIDDSVFTISPVTSKQDSTASLRLRFAYALHTDAGLQRGELGEPNEDSLVAVTFDAPYENGASIGLFLVADGVGGADAGEVASQLALQELAHEWVAHILLPEWNGNPLSDERLRKEIVNGFAQANARLIEYQNTHQLQFGTTLTGALIMNERAYIVNVGDSRTYLFRENALTHLTEDHSYVGLLVSKGLLHPDEIYTHPQRNLILRSLGDANLEADVFPTGSGAFALQRGDRLVICSDGLWEMVRDNDIKAVLQQTPDPQLACAELVNRANLAGGVDNISLILVHIK